MNTIIKGLFINGICALLFPILSFAGMDQPWNELDNGGGGNSITIVSVIVVIAYFFFMFKWPAQFILLTAAFLVGATINNWFGSLFGIIIGIGFFIWGYKEFIVKAG